ncbi:MAG: hypothetical protein HRU18_09030 [Pseudoalteromonas sp.]|uniref:hypothetical protein n=1 Tax=Pseudoalteromonas sp. TaxID=53249 RepID=UPI001D9BDEB0|nr:hypothetical protein [Pseudoalteromonas sp.]NRA78341.1 hypothetical protein [Pseudoalteromonas sp.]
MSNSLTRFNQILNKNTRTIAKVIEINSNGTTTVEFSDSSQIAALGKADDAAINVYIENGRVSGTAADLPFSELEI